MADGGVRSRHRQEHARPGAENGIDDGVLIRGGRDAHMKKEIVAKATISSGDLIVPDIPCIIYRPQIPGKKPYIEFRPDQTQYAKLCPLPKGTLSLETADTGVATSIQADSVWFSEHKPPAWNKGFLEASILGRPEELIITKRFLKKTSQRKTSITCWISPNSMLNPVQSRTISNDGCIEVENIAICKMTLKNNEPLSFEKQYDVQEQDGKKTILTSYLVAKTKSTIAAAAVEKIKNDVLSDIEDVLLLASLAARTRTACLGWMAIDSKVSVECYWGYLSVPSGKSDYNLDQGLVCEQNFESFIVDCYRSFQEYSDQEWLRNAIYPLVSLHKISMEPQFLSLYAGLESILLHFQRKNKLECVLSSSKWQVLKKELTKWIHDYTKDPLEKEQREFMYANLEELNHVPIRKVYERFNNEYSVNCADLWPVFDVCGKVSLSMIRNFLIHGAPLPGKCHRAFGVALIHLRWTLERTIISILGWPVEKTEVDAGYLKRNSPMLPIWVESQATLAPYFKRK